MRKLVTVQTIADVVPMDADAIIAYKVLGWTVVDAKSAYQVGDKVAFFEPDSFLRGDNPVFESFMARGVKTVALDGKDVQGHVLRTAKLRGVISQGLLMPLDRLGLDPATPVGTDITEAVGVVKWEPPLPTGTNIVGPFDTRFAPKTDAVRIQSIADKWDLIKAVEWEPTVKVDGTSQTLVNDGGALRIFGRNWELAPDSAGMKIAERAGLTEAVQPGMAIQFELVGPGIQANRLKLQTQRAIVFAVWQDGVKLARSAWPEAALANSTPVLGDEWQLQGDLDTMLDKVSNLRGSVTKDVLDEGVVWHPVDPATVPEELASVLDRNMNVKIVSAKWLLKGGE